MNCNLCALSAIAAILCLLPNAAVAQERDFGFSIGYAQLSLDDQALDGLDSQGGIRFEPRFTWSPSDERNGLRLGVGIGFSFFSDEDDTDQTIGGFAEVEDYQQISLLVPEFQATWRQRLGEHYLIEGGIGIGAVIGNFRAGQVVFNDLFDEDVSEWDVGLGIRPLVRAGYTRNRWIAGIEASYLFTDLDFDDGLGGQMDELYIGLFYSHAI